MEHNFPIHKYIQQKTPTRSPSQGVDRHRGPVLLWVYQHKILAKSFFEAGQRSKNKIISDEYSTGEE